ncbi:disulfide isomerase [Xanthomonas oryzae pv. oryzicola BLS256]|uniref:Disulfide isomerase n=1 Tax=Xanthomonas oryzae pv. oryzicola (strain BLS256) TaxID=383407 RepID=G7TLF2_XANOB|nr:disulfide isomerase [Xanthomonas oryzae pv. oryzicola BLS256]
MVVKVDLGNFDRHLDISQRYGTPIQTGRSGGVADRQAATPRVPVSWRMRAR